MNLLLKIKSLEKELIEPSAGRALIIGPGTSGEPSILVGMGFNVDAIEPNAEVQAIEGLSVIKSRVEEVKIRGTYDIILAQSVFFFVTGAKKILNKMDLHLSKGGILAFNILGDKDDWAGEDGIKTFTTKELHQLEADILKNCRKIFFCEEVGLGQTRSGKPKNWHIYNVIFKKTNN